MPFGWDIIFVSFGIIALLRTGLAFRCHVCTSEDDESCDKMPRHSRHCKFLATGCLKLVNDVINYRFVDKHGLELKLEDWDGSDTGWNSVPYVEKVVIRRCANDYSRYRVKRGCHKVPFYEKTGSTRGNDIVCYCETELCNEATMNRVNDTTLCILFAIVHTILSIF